RVETWGEIPIQDSGIQASLRTRSMGGSGYLATGTFDPVSKTFAAPALTHKQRLAVQNVIMKLPANWKLGTPSSAGDDVLWYPVSVSGAKAPTASVPAPLTLNGENFYFGPYDIPD